MIMIILTMSSYTLWVTAATVFSAGKVAFVSRRPCSANFSPVLLPKLTEGRGYIKTITKRKKRKKVQELCESRGGRPGLSVLTSLLVSVDVKLY